MALKTNDDCEVKSVKDDKKSYDIDTLLEYGKYQAIRVWGFGILLAYVSGVMYTHIMFVLQDPTNWECENKQQMKCNEKLPGRESICEGGDVVFNTTDENYFKSALVENLWICNEKYLGPSAMTAQYFGYILNGLVFSYLSDRYGRKKIFFVTNVLYIIFRLIAYHTSQYYGAFVFFCIMSSQIVSTRIGYTLLAEICDEKGRNHNYLVGWVFWVLGMVLTPLLAWYIRDWYIFGLISVLTNVILVICHPFIPESPRWFINEKKFKEAADLINEMRKVNGQEEFSDLEMILKEGNKEVETENTKTMLKNSQIFRVVCLMSVIWIVNDFFYITGQLMAENLQGNIFINFSLLALTELPSVFVGQFLIDRYGRRWVHCGFMVLATVPMLLCTILVNHDEQAVRALTIVSKVSSNIGWFVMWVQAIEIFPVSLRNTGISIASVFATLVSMTGPFVVDLGKINLMYPYLVFSVLGSIGAISTSLVPETKGLSIAESSEDTIDLVKKFKYREWKTWNKEK